MSEQEFVGHTIDEKGMHFSRDKIEKVLEVKEPIYGKELKSFLGLAGWFHDHIENYARIIKPLQKMIDKYERNRKLIWTDQGRVAFHAIKEAINYCPKLFFINDKDEVVLFTDACDYGLGAVLYQIVEGKMIPICFASKLLSRQELRWSTIEKEAYAIIFAFKKFEYLIRDRKFTLKTDHKNLTFIDKELNA